MDGGGGIGKIGAAAFSNSTRHISGGRPMKKVALVIASVVLLFATGCATKGDVKSQVDPLSDRIGRVEARLNAIEAKPNQPMKPAELSESDRAALEEAKTMATKATALANKAESEATRAGGNADRAEAAAKKAEDAASAAEKSAAKAEKIFRLEQKKEGERRRERGAEAIPAPPIHGVRRTA